MIIFDSDLHFEPVDTEQKVYENMERIWGEASSAVIVMVRSTVVVCSNVRQVDSATADGRTAASLLSSHYCSSGCM